MINIKTIDDIFLDYIKNTIKQNKNHEGYIILDDNIIHFAYFDEIDDYIIGIDNTDNDSCELSYDGNISLKKGSIIKAFKENKLAMFTDMDITRRCLMEINVTKFIDKYFEQ